MALNYLEQLLSEWYEYQGYFVRRNIFVGRRKKGGYETELDIIAFNPETKHLIHLEPSMDAYSWAKREKRYKKKFQMGKDYIPKIFKGFELPNEIEQVAVLVFASTKNYKTIGGGKIRLVDEFIEEIFQSIQNKTISSEAISEHMSILRTLQFVSEYREVVKSVWGE